MAYDDNGSFSDPVNVDAIYRTMVGISERTLNMDTWGGGTECGTTACLAGHAALVHGKAEYRPFKGDDGKTHYSLEVKEGDSDFAYLGAEVLGFNYEQAQIFYRTSIDTLDELWVELERQTEGQVSKAGFEAWLETHPEYQIKRGMLLNEDVVNA